MILSRSAKPDKGIAQRRHQLSRFGQLTFGCTAEDAHWGSGRKTDAMSPTTATKEPFTPHFASGALAYHPRASPGDNGLSN